ncbi:MAG TPA: ABC transporter permease [Gemmataceae bacterium]|nr:ABC transporter permease [Gemmataceae bacterium]
MYFVTFILKNLTRRPVRTALTVLGLSVAIGSMVALLGISNNFVESVVSTFERRGVDLVVVPGGQTDQLSGKVDEWVVEAVRKLDKVATADPGLIDVAEMWQRDPRNENDTPPSMQVMVQAWPPENFQHSDLEILDGRVLAAEDAGQHRVILGSTLAENLGKKVGDKVTFLGKQYEVIGVYKSFNVFETGSILLLLKDYQKEVGLEGKITGFTVQVKKGANPDADIEEVRQAIKNLKDPDGKPVRLSAERPRDYAEKASHLRLTRAMAWMVSAIAIVIGVISMLNTMVMSVLERTQEIGILRAVGWTKFRIVRMVLGEAVFLGLAAAAVGVVGALAITYLLSMMPRVNGFIEGGISPRVIVEGVLMTVLIGLAGGAYPAIRAARMLPTEAIRHD